MFSASIDNSTSVGSESRSESVDSPNSVQSRGAPSRRALRRRAMITPPMQGRTGCRCRRRLRHQMALVQPLVRVRILPQQFPLQNSLQPLRFLRILLTILQQRVNLEVCCRIFQHHQDRPMFRFQYQIHLRFRVKLLFVKGREIVSLNSAS